MKILADGAYYGKEPRFSRTPGDQMVSNLTATLKDMPSSDRADAHREGFEARHGAATNYFREKTNTLVQPSSVKTRRDGERLIVEGTTAFAGPEPVRSYEVRSGNKVLLSLPFRPQMYETRYSVSLPASTASDGTVTVVASQAQPMA